MQQATIAFVNNDKDSGLLQDFHPNVRMVRVTPDSHPLPSQLASQGRLLWMDPMIDGYHLALRGSGKLAKAWDSYRASLEGECGLDGLKVLQGRSNRDKAKLVDTALEKCTERVQPRWITVPQLPVISGTGRNKVNRSLAGATGEWLSKSGFAGKLVLPLVFTHQRQIRIKTNYGPKIDVAKKCYADAGASALWAVDATLEDQKGTRNFPQRFQALVNFHKDLRESFPEATIAAGPYWGMNLVLWARKLCDCPAVTLGRGFQYSVSGTFLKKGKARIAIPPLRRWAIVSPDLRKWLDKTLKALSPQDPAYGELSVLRKRYQDYLAKDAAVRQVAEFYSEWLRRLSAFPAAGRALALYQDFSSGFVLGRQLPSMPEAERSARRPERVAEQLMLHCL